MHELGLARNIVSIVAEHARGRAVSSVRLVMGPYACVEEQSLRFCLEVVGEGTELAKAAIEFLPGEGDQFIIKDFEMEETV
ncbi:MAG: hydrogenase maturation nickel metallochaperone HypA [Sphingomonas sp.]